MFRLLAVSLIVATLGLSGAHAQASTGAPPTSSNSPGSHDLALSGSFIRGVDNGTHLSLTLANHGSHMATDIVLRALLSPSDLGWTEAEEMCELQGGSFECRWDWMMPGRLELVVAGPLSCQELAARVTVESRGDTDAANNRIDLVSPTFCGGGADLELAHSWWTNETHHGVRSTVKNHGPEDAREVVGWIEIWYDFYLEDIYADEGFGAECRQPSPNRLTCTLADLGAGAEFVFGLIADGPACGPDRRSLSNVTAADDFIEGNNRVLSTWDPPTCPHEADIVVRVVEERLGDDVGIELTYTNAGPSKVENGTFFGGLSFQFDHYGFETEATGCDFHVPGRPICNITGMLAGEARKITWRGPSPYCGFNWVEATVRMSNDHNRSNDHFRQRLETCRGDAPPPTDTTPNTPPNTPTTSPTAPQTTPIPYFPSWASVLAALAVSGLGVGAILRRRK